MSLDLHNKPQVQTTLIIAAHGSPVDPNVNRTIETTADRIRSDNSWQQVLTAFHHGSPGFVEVLNQVRSTNVVIVPLVTSDGYFAELARNEFTKASKKYPQLRIAISEPIGTHPDVPVISAQRLNHLMEQRNWSVQKSAILIVGHGTRKHTKSRTATRDLATAIGRLIDDLPTEPLVAFIDDDPNIDEVLPTIHQSRLVVFPFLIANGPHARIDIPAGLGLRTQNNVTESTPEFVRDKEILVDHVFGTLPEIDEMIVDRASEAYSTRATEPNGIKVLTGARS